uniref:Uncharacterized protein At4g15545 isoform X2 n=1 Tax=Elaeis guineensis var. tenera TaxID=51953 RepID=A0A6I9SL40_ELAGV|nr:uncharacterized protein At4g15545 isoform X2 [Elaeis guineensis]
MAQNGADFHLPDEILSVIPTDPYEQLDVARKITSMAIASRVTRLEDEARRLRQKISERDRLISELQDRLDHLDRKVHDSDARLRAALEENERDMLALTSKKLGRDLAKLETFKRHLVQSLHDDSMPEQSEAIDVGTSDELVARIPSWRDEGFTSHTASDLVSISSESGDSTQDVTSSRHAGHHFSITPYITPRLTPSTTPKVSSTGGSPRGFSTAGSSPKMLSGTTSPTKSRFEGQLTLSSLYPPSQQSSATSPPPHRHSLTGRPRIDGKEFFRQARSRLSYEQFGAFLANIKEFNAHTQTCEETLAKSEEIFGTENKDLYLSFKGLLNRNLP